MATKEIRITIQDGKVENWSDIVLMIESLKDGRHRIKAIQEEEAIRKKQRSTYWAWNGQVEHETQVSAYALHHENKLRFLHMLQEDSDFSTESLGPELYSRFMDFVKLHYLDYYGVDVTIDPRKKNGI